MQKMYFTWWIRIPAKLLFTTWIMKIGYDYWEYRTAWRSKGAVPRSVFLTIFIVHSIKCHLYIHIYLNLTHFTKLMSNTR